MNKTIKFIDNVKLKDLIFTFTKDTPLATMEEFIENNLYLPEYYGYDDTEYIVFSRGICELLHNSIRASLEKDTKSKIKLEIFYYEKYISFIITNGAGGFDFNEILYSPDVKLEVMSEKSTEYHEKTRRGGFGLYMASKMFDDFKILFLDNNDKIIEYKKGFTKGTKIIFNLVKKE